MKILTKYVTKQFSANISISLLLFIFILLMDRVFQLVNLLITKGLSIFSVITLILYSIPTMLTISMPMAVLAGGIMTFGRMASDGEVTIVRTSGSSLKPLLFPVLFATFILSIFMVPFNYNIAPASQQKFREKFLNIAMKDPALRLEESTLIDLPPYTILCLKVDHKNHKLEQILINKSGDTNEPAVSISAKNGTWFTAESGELILDLYNGSIKHQPSDNPDKLSNINFQNYRLTLSSPKTVTKKSKNIESMTAAQLKEEISRLKEKDLPAHNIETRYFLRGSLAWAIFILLAAGLPFGIRAEHKGKTIGIGISIALIAIYYFLMVAGIKLAFGKILPPIVGVWLPNLIIAVPGGILLYKSYYK